MQWIVVATLTVLGLTYANAAQNFPPEVQASIDEVVQNCKEKPVFLKGFVTRRDINGDGVIDYILDLGRFSCGDNSILYCGSAGCVTTVFASLRNGKYIKVLDENVRGLEFERIGGVPAMILGLHGSACGKVGAEPCGSTLYWDGTNFTPAH